jgi:hypothetical protein
MRKLMMAVVAVAGLGLMAGCKSNNVEGKRQDVAEARQDVAQEQQNAQQEVAEVRQDAQQDVAEAQKDLTEEQSELSRAQHEQLRDDDQLGATGGSGTANSTADVKTEDVKGTIQSTSGNTLKLIVPDKNNQVMQFQANSQVRVMKDDKPVALTDLKAGDEVRASYQMDPNGKMVLQSIEVEKMSAQHPGQQKK